jgi:hypothetical protein
MPKTYPDKSLPAGRIAIGIAAWAAPQLMGPVLGLALADSQEGKFMSRLFGARDVILGIGPLASSGPARKLWLRLGVACDLVDVAAAGLGLLGGAPKRAMITAGSTALAASALGVAALRSAD